MQNTYNPKAEWRKRNPDYARNYYLNNKEKIKKLHKNYRENNTEYE